MKVLREKVIVAEASGLALGRPTRRPFGSEAGNMLFLVTILGAACVVIVGTAMSLAQTRNLISMRSAAWNDAMPVAEAGVEEAMTQIQYGNTATNGWVLTNGYYTKTQLSPFNDSSSYYSVVISTNNPPTITSAGYVLVPMQSYYLQRTVQVTTSNSPGPFPYGILAKSTISISGQAIMDSFTSTSPLYSSNGQYVASMAQANATVGSDSSANPTISIGSGEIYGYVATGPGGAVTGGPVGDAAWVNGGNSGIEAGHSQNNLNIAIPDVTVPYRSGAGVASGSFTVNGTSYTYCLGSNTYYYSGSFLMQSHQSMIVTGQANLYVTGSFSVTGQASIIIATNGSLNLYVGSTNSSGNDTAQLAGGGVINQAGVATDFRVWCLASVKTATIAGNSTFIGAVYAPEADTTTAGGTTVIGALVVNSLSSAGGMTMHYDSALGASGGMPVYYATSWREL